MKRLIKLVGPNMFRQLNCRRLFNQLGNKLLNCLKSAVAFFSAEESEAIFRASGIKPVVNDKWTILVVVGTSTGKQPLRTNAGRGSRQPDLLRGLYVNSLMSSWLTSWKLFNSVAFEGNSSSSASDRSVFLATRAVWIFSTLALKLISYDCTAD